MCEVDRCWVRVLSCIDVTLHVFCTLSISLAFTLLEQTRPTKDPCKRFILDMHHRRKDYTKNPDDQIAPKITNKDEVVQRHANVQNVQIQVFLCNAPILSQIKPWVSYAPSPQ